MRVEWTFGARRDLLRIYDFNARRSEAYAQRVERRLADRIALIARAPRAGRTIMGGDVRRMSVPDIQYILIYAVVGDALRVIAIHHTREDRQT